MDTQRAYELGMDYPKKVSELNKEIETLRARLAKIKEHLLIAKEYIDATECTQPCDSLGVCFRCSIEGDILLSLKEYS